VGLLLVERQIVIHGALKAIIYRISIILSNISERYAAVLMKMELQNRGDSLAVRVFRIRKLLLEINCREALAHSSMIPFSFSRSRR
jgi:hypothetical protein